ncbi:hypothetical protein E4K10_04965 [Streptomyces sp. T1317-0309]|nr:hypothetical protein E4K10_04965 [Streptomyces sp. T1317-0309]
MLIDLDLGRCHFADARNLDQLYHSGCEFEKPPRLSWAMGVIPIRPVRRDVLADERSPEVGRSTVASLYRQLRKGREDAPPSRREAHDHYRALDPALLLADVGVRLARHARTRVAPRGHHSDDHPDDGRRSPQCRSRSDSDGNMPPAGGQVELQVRTPDAKLTVPIRSRFTKERANSALKVVLNSVVFRSSGQNLTTWGTYVEMASRFTEPLLLVLAGLAIHGRVKRG